MSIVPLLNVTSILIGYKQHAYLSEVPIREKYRLVFRQTKGRKVGQRLISFMSQFLADRDVKLPNKTVMLSYSSGKYRDLFFERSLNASRVTLADR